MDPLDELYQTIIMQHARHPRHYGRLQAPAACVEGYNPLCGDQVGACAVVADGRFSSLHCFGQGCAISKASASLMVDLLQGKSTQEFYTLFQTLQDALTGDDAALERLQQLGDIAALGGVRHFPQRVKCATLGWQALKAALEGRSGTLDT